MPILPAPDYYPGYIFTNPHIHTLYPTLFRSKEGDCLAQTERIATPDGDFLDIDWHFCRFLNSETLVIISHGLEGHSRKKYPLGMARHMNCLGFDAVCLNFRGCSGEPNRLPRLYHSGVTDDLHTVLLHSLQKKGYKQAFLVGFSMGGNQILKYLGENPQKVPPEVKGAVAFSVPCDLGGASQVMDKIGNRLYMLYFMRGLHGKIRIKARMFPEFVNSNGLRKILTFKEFDDRYTAPLHGFDNAADYYQRCSCKQFLHNIHVPSLVVQAKDDPFLSESCYPKVEAENNRNLFLQMPKYGGHVGFYAPKSLYWSEKKAGKFLKEIDFNKV